MAAKRCLHFGAAPHKSSEFANSECASSESEVGYDSDKDPEYDPVGKPRQIAAVSDAEVSFNNDK